MKPVVANIPHLRPPLVLSAHPYYLFYAITLIASTFCQHNPNAELNLICMASLRKSLYLIAFKNILKQLNKRHCLCNRINMCHSATQDNTVNPPYPRMFKSLWPRFIVSTIKHISVEITGLYPNLMLLSCPQFHTNSFPSATVTE